jgi:hypothetical protein
MTDTSNHQPDEVRPVQPGAYPYPTPPPPPAPPARRGWVRRHPLWTIAIVGAVLIVIGSVAASGGGDSTTAEPATTAPAPKASAPLEPSSTTSTAPVGPVTVKAGTPVNVDVDPGYGSDVTHATITVGNPSSAKAEPVEYGMTPENGLYVVVDVAAVVDPGSSGTFSIGEGDFHLVAADGTVYETTYADFGPALDYHDLSVGQRAGGKVVFDIPPGKLAGAKVQLDDQYEDYGKPLAFWTL